MENNFDERLVIFIKDFKNYSEKLYNDSHNKIYPPIQKYNSFHRDDIYCAIINLMRNIMPLTGSKLSVIDFFKNTSQISFKSELIVFENEEYDINDSDNDDGENIPCDKICPCLKNKYSPVWHHPCTQLLKESFDTTLDIFFLLQHKYETNDIIVCKHQLKRKIYKHDVIADTIMCDNKNKIV